MRRARRTWFSNITAAICAAMLCISVSVTAAEYMPNFKDTDINEFINI